MSTKLKLKSHKEW